MSNPVFWEDKKNIIIFLSAELVQRVVMVNVLLVEFELTLTRLLIENTKSFFFFFFFFCKLYEVML